MDIDYCTHGYISVYMACVNQHEIQKIAGFEGKNHRKDTRKAVTF